MKTEIIRIDSENQKGAAEKAAKLLREGALVAIPTETVYGLGANALDENAVKSIFQAKGRPQDNPLIVHISEIEEIYNLVKNFPESARKLAAKFWPGPMTLILKKSSKVPDTVTAGLDTVAVRLPRNETARAIIKQAGVPVAAPSANLSGSPSPTDAQSVYDDMNGRIPLIIDGGRCEVGVESTVISLIGEKAKILRPGGVTAQQIRDVLGDVEIDKAVLNEVSKDEKVSSPGMKYKHYAPKTKVVIVKGDDSSYRRFLNEQTGKFGALCFEEDAKYLKCKFVTYGKSTNPDSQSAALFSALRQADNLGVDVIFARYPNEEGIGLAVLNRLLRSAAFDVKEV